MQKTSYNQYILNKSNNAINVSNNLTLLERKCFNQILVALQKHPINTTSYQIPANVFLDIIGNKQGSYKKNRLITILNNLLTKCINLIAPTDTSFKQCTYLASHELEDGIIEFELSTMLKTHLKISNDTTKSLQAYTKIDLSIVNKLHSTHSIALYEFLKCKAMNFKSLKVKAKLELLRDITSSNAPYYQKFNRFNYYVLKHAIEEINAKTDIKINDVILNKGIKGNNIEELIFMISQQEITSNQSELEQKPQKKIIQQEQQINKEEIILEVTDKELSLNELIGQLKNKNITLPEVQEIKELKQAKTSFNSIGNCISCDLDKIKEQNQINEIIPKNEDINLINKLLDFGITHKVTNALYKKDKIRLNAIYEDVIKRYKDKNKTSKDYASIIVSMFNNGANPGVLTKTEQYEKDKKNKIKQKNQEYIEKEELSSKNKMDNLIEQYDNAVVKFKQFTTDVQENILKSFVIKNSFFKDNKSLHSKNYEDKFFSSSLGIFLLQEKLV